MKRFLLNLLTALSLLLCVTVSVLWVRSLGQREYSYWVAPELSIEVTELDGVVGFLLTRDSGVRPPVSGTDRLYGWFRSRAPMPPGRDRASLMTPSFNRWGFGFHAGRSVGPPPAGYWRLGGRRLWIIWVPYWLPALLTAIFPTVRFAEVVRRRRRAKHNLCPSCGYDLRATPGRCPECGTRARNAAALAPSTLE